MSEKTVPKRRELEYIPLDRLELLELRDVRENVVEEIAQRIEETEYNPARPMRVVPREDAYAVVDGNHRLKALRRLDEDSGQDSVPCVVEQEDADVYALSHSSNQDESTYAEEDLWDHLDFISALREENSQANISDRLGWSRSKVAKYSALLNELVPEVLDYARSRQEGRGTEDVPSVTFSEGWFRNSGLYDLNREGNQSWAEDGEEEAREAQMRVMEWYVDHMEGDVSQNYVQSRVEETLSVCEQLDILDQSLSQSVDAEIREELREEVIAGTYTESTLESAIENANSSAKDRAVFGIDCLEGLESIEDDSIDCVVTDPPWGVEYENDHKTENPHFDDTEENAFGLLEAVMPELKRVCKANAHLYVVYAMARHERMLELAREHFEVQDIPLIWTKHNITPTVDPGGYSRQYAMKYEPILHMRMPKGDERELNGPSSANVLDHAAPPGPRRHVTQKPVSLMSELIVNSTGKRETVLDPFAGSGATLLAAAQNGRHYVGFELDETYEAGFKKELGKISEEK
jgi:site-specific DNA-methyltransferase (adenine-specific)